MSPIFRILFATWLLVLLAGCSGTHQLPPDFDVNELRPGTYPTRYPPTIANVAPTNLAVSNALIRPPLNLTNFTIVPPASTHSNLNKEVLRGSLIPPQVIDRYPLDRVWIPLRDWCLMNKFSEPRRSSSSEGSAFSFNIPAGTVTLVTGSQVVNWCGISLYLGFPLELIGGHPYVTALDVRKNFEPLLGMAYTHKRGNVIVIDPGHGGSDVGTRNISNNRNEAEFTLDWATRLKASLVAQGWTVYLTRTSDVNVKLPDRVNFADSVKADVFLSLHFNSAYPETHEYGLETYCMPSRGMPSNLTRGSPDPTSVPVPNNVYDAENLQLAERIHRSLLKVNGHQDRGVRRARFLGVLKYQQRPAVLVEGGYLSNPDEARKIADPAYRQQLAEAVAEALRVDAPPRLIAEKPVLPTNSVDAHINAVDLPTNSVASKP